jgi:hypothetical protein
MTPQHEAAGTPLDWTQRLGRKVSVRFRIHDDAEHPFSEAIGVVSSVTKEDGTEIVTIVDRRGGITKVPAPDLLASKLFPL